MIRFRWHLDKVRKFSTEDIFKKLHSFGILLTPEKFLEDVEKAYGSEDITEHWESEYTVTTEEENVDFIWMAAIVLWERLAPDVMSTEKLEDLIEQGYDVVEYNPATACKVWLETWQQFKQWVKPDIQSIQDAESTFKLIYDLDGWCQDLLMYLGNLGLEDDDYYYQRITYCQDFCQRFPKTDDSSLVFIKKAEAESYIYLGNIEAAENLFQKLVDQFPQSTWGYIGWGDMYCQESSHKQVTLDYAKAETIYKMALKNNVDQPKVVRDRLRALAQKTGGKGFGHSKT